MVEVGTGTKGTRYIKTNYPNEDGLTAGTTSQTGHKESLTPEDKSLIHSKDKPGIY